ncbi:Uncharacterised protein [Bordetella pertussis]|nr:Uncharacterised protein [Bordetella pertussis]
MTWRATRVRSTTRGAGTSAPGFCCTSSCAALRATFSTACISLAASPRSSGTDAS